MSKWALVTGASRGIGRVVALALADAGINVVAHSSNLSGTADLIPEIEAKGVSAFAVAADLTDPAAISTMASQIIERVNIDLLFNNAGANYSPNYLNDNDAAQAWLKTYLVNVVAPDMLISKLLPGMLARGYGRIINTTSGIENIPCSYAASKGALNKLTKDYAFTLAGTGVTMNLFDPGLVRTELGGDDAPDDVSTVIPGAIVGGFLDDAVNSTLIKAEDFCGMTLAEAITAAPSLVNELR